MQAGAAEDLSRPRFRQRTIENFYFYLFVGPWIVGFLFLTAGPMLFSIALTFTRWGIVGEPSFLGLQNWSQVFTKDPLFWQSLKVTAVYTVFHVPVNLVAGFMLAFLMNSKVRGIAVFRTIYYLPSVLSGVAVAILWMYIFSPYLGLINSILRLVGVQGPMWLQDESWVLPAFIVMGLWGVGSAMVIYLAGLQSIPTELYEAASIDGCGAVRSLWHITVPIMTPIIFFNLIMGIIGSFQTFTSAFVMTAGGPNWASYFYILYLFQKAFVQMDMGYASVLAWILFAIIGFFTAIVFRSSDRWVHYS